MKNKSRITTTTSKGAKLVDELPYSIEEISKSFIKELEIPDNMLKITVEEEKITYYFEFGSHWTKTVIESI